LELLSTGARICILESGGLTPERARARRWGGESVGYPYTSLDRVSDRALGGTSHSWEFWHACPLDRIDFEARGAAAPGWPFERAALVPFYRRAEEICRADPFDYAPSADGDDPLSARLPVTGGSVVVRSLQILTSTFGEQAERLIQASKVHLVLNAVASALLTESGDDRVTAVRALTAPGRELTVRARTYVLAAGGIETPRLLLLSNTTQAHGLGNAHDQIGRYFTEHLAARSGVIVPSGRDLLAERGLYLVPGSLYTEADRGRAISRTVLTLADDVLREQQLLNVAFLLEASPRALACNGTRSLATLARSAASRPLPPAMGSHAVAVFRDLGSVSRTLVRRARHSAGEAEVLVMRVQAEQQPTANSRVTLGRKRDALGLPVSCLDWRLSPLDTASIRHAQDVLDEELRAARLGAVEDKLGSERPPVLFYGHHHHLGTTRMHADPEQGVVDADCRVHGMSNLFIAGSSVFPTGGWANPTLTIVALAARLADHLKRAYGYT
jgi:choline dehydrogenase-like flavoprotein